MATKNTIRPLFDNVLVKPTGEEQTTPGGIILPDTAKEKPQIGEIVSVGEGAFDEDGERMPMVVKVGQKVMYTKWGGNDIKVGNEEWKIVKQTDILAIIE